LHILVDKYPSFFLKKGYSKLARRVIEIVMIGCLLCLVIIIFTVLYSFFMLFAGEIQEISFDLPAVWITVFCLIFVLMVLRRLTK
jgi:hypothetical protein